MSLVYYTCWWLCKRFKIAAALVIAENKWTRQLYNPTQGTWKWTVPKLKNELVVRGEVTTGRKAYLICIFCISTDFKISVVWQAGLLHIIIVGLSGLWLSELGFRVNSTLYQSQSEL